jgi:O-antigen/teichoic acid export membrane protein
VAIEKVTLPHWFGRITSGSIRAHGIWPVLRDAATLGVGSFLSQALLLLATPIFLRFYRPADFGLYSFAYGLIALAATLGTWKVERFIVIAPARRVATRLLTAMVWLGVTMAMVVLVTAPLAVCIARHILGGTANGIVLIWLAPLSIFVFVASTGMRFYTVRIGRFNVISAAQISRTMVFTTGTVVTGLFWGKPDVNGALIMLAWQIAADACALFVQIRASPNVARLIVLRPRFRWCCAELRKYQRTLGILTLSELISAGNLQVQISTVILIFGAAAGGWFALARSLVFVPCSIISAAVNDVTNQRLSRYYAERKPFYRIVLQATQWMAAVGIVPFASIMILAPAVLPHVMGSRWAGAAPSVVVLAVASYFNFISAPGVTVMIIVQARRYILLWHATRLAVAASLSALAGFGLVSYSTWLALLTAAESVAYITSAASGSIFARTVETKRAWGT